MEHKPALWFAVFLSVIGAVVNLGQPLIVGKLIDAVQNKQDVTGWAVGLVAVLLGTAITGGLMYYVLAKAGEGVVLSARTKMANRLLRLPIKEYDLRRTGDLVSRVGSDTTLLRAVLTQGFVDAAGGVLIFVGSIVAMAVIDPLLLAITLAVIAIAIASVAFTSRKIKAATTKAQTRVGDMAASVERALSAVRTIRAARAEVRESEEITRNSQEAYEQGVKIAKLNAAVTPIAGLAFQGAFIAVLGVGGYRVANGDTSIANLITFVLLMFTMSRPLGQAFGAYSSIQSALGALARIQEVLDVELEETNEEVKQQEKRKGSNSTAIEFKKVNFGYGDAEVLTNVSFKIERGTRVAIVGPSGSGKSTSFSLIERFYEPTSGQILMDGQPVTHISRNDLRAQIGYVEQDAPVLAGSLRDNLLIGKPDATDAELKKVLKEVNLTDVLKRDKRGLEAEVGENGIMLSGGERQRLAIARALLAAPPILLLDESTASLDGLNEQRMREALDAVAKNRTVIVIAHRLSTVVDSDQIIVMQSGKVIGTGTHKQLLKSTPLYKELAATQMLD
jgi:ATP-binding cassette subfamily B protein